MNLESVKTGVIESESNEGMAPSGSGMHVHDADGHASLLKHAG